MSKKVVNGENGLKSPQRRCEMVKPEKLSSKAWPFRTQSKRKQAKVNCYYQKSFVQTILKYPLLLRSSFSFLRKYVKSQQITSPHRPRLKFVFLTLHVLLLMALIYKKISFIIQEKILISDVNYTLENHITGLYVRVLESLLINI